MKELLQAGIDMNVKNSGGKHALDLAKTPEVGLLRCVSGNQQQLMLLGTPGGRCAAVGHDRRQQ